MSDSQLFIQNQQTTLSGAGASIGDTTITLSSLTQNDGTLITMADVGTKGYATIEPGNGSQEESITFSGITQNANGTATLTGVKTTLTVAPYTETSGLAITHAGGTTFILTNTAAFYNALTGKGNDEIITGVWTFTQSPIVPTPTTDYQAATKKYVSDTITGLVGTATSSNAGTTKLSVDPAVPGTPVAVGDNDTRVPTQGENDALVGNNTDVAVGTGNKMVTQTGLQHSAEVYAASTTGNDTYVVTLSPAPTSYTAGMTIRFKPDTANTGACSLNVNGLGAIAIKKKMNVDLDTNDILAGQMVEVIYDGSGTPYFQMVGASLIAQANATTLTGGTSSNADALHTHASLGLGQQSVAYYAGNVTTEASVAYTTSNPTGTVVYSVQQLSSTSLTIQRWTKDAGTGVYSVSHSTTLTGLSANIAALSCSLAGSYLYVIFTDNSGGNRKVYRYDAADLANVTSMTFSGTSFNIACSFSDGTFLYVQKDADEYYKYSISGTTISDSATITYTSKSGTTDGAISDGTSVWFAYNNSGALTIYKYPIAGGAASATAITRVIYPTAYPNTSAISLIIAKTGYLAYCWSYTLESNAAVTGAALKINPITAN
jgi:hypothetical protein